MDATLIFNKKQRNFTQDQSKNTQATKDSDEQQSKDFPDDSQEDQWDSIDRIINSKLNTQQ